MARICDITGKKVMVGNNVSHSNRKTKRKFYPNLQTKKFFVPESGEWVTLKVATSALRTIDKNGITSVLKKALENDNVLLYVRLLFELKIKLLLLVATFFLTSIFNIYEI